VEALARDRHRWVDFMMRFELGLEKPDAARAPASALTIGLSYTVGGLIPLLPYVLVRDIGSALQLSILLTLIALALPERVAYACLTYALAASKAPLNRLN